MKIKTILGFMAIGAFALTSCNDEVNPPIENGLYLAEATSNKTFSQQTESITVGIDPIQKTLTAKLAKAVSEDVKVTFELDETLIEQYNSKNGTAYQLIPSASLDFEEGKEIVIPAGKVASESEVFTIRYTKSPNAEVYAIPVRMRYISGPVDIVGNSDHILYLLAAPNIQKSIIVHRGNETSFQIPEVTANEFTIEFWVKVNNKTGWVPSESEPWFGFGKGNDPSKSKRQRIFGDNCGPITVGDVLLRWWADGASGIGPTLQFQTSKGYFDSNEWWEADTWYHIAYTWDGKTARLYKDGVQDRENGQEGPFVFKNVNLFNLSGSGSQAWQMEMEMAQIRIWTKCLTPSGIIDGMSRAISSDADGLYAYWPCDEGTGNVLKGSGKAAVDVTVRGTAQWSETMYDFSKPNQ
ncbi:MAG: DUF1735 and LamG domain-containing protein [Bacteroidales bacterium]|nr:DUF1735 and LamG domain-containing protein [Bacteroidales bacterium]